MIFVNFFFKNDDKDSDNQNYSTDEICEGANAEIPVPPNVEKTAEFFLKQYETDETKLMSNDQLQRFVLLQKVHVLTLERKRLEHLNNIDNAKKVAIDYIGFDDGTNSTFENI